MKKILIILMLVLLLIPSVIAESVDYNSMTTDDLLALRNQINGILIERMASDASAIYSGNYTVGVDIKAGRYVLQFDEIAEGETTGIVMLFENTDKWHNRDYISADYLRTNVEYQIVLEDSMVLEITRAKGTIRAIAKPEWAP